MFADKFDQYFLDKAKNVITLTNWKKRVHSDENETIETLDLDNLKFRHIETCNYSATDWEYNEEYVSISFSEKTNISENLVDTKAEIKIKYKDKQVEKTFIFFEHKE
jgi:hypothetical protein